MTNAVVRYFAAFVILLYAFAKINGSQFTILDSELDKPMGQVSGFWLTWYYFSFSRFYGMFLALGQIAGALLLTFRRTALLGACILLPILTNIVLIDVFYGVELSATIVALLLLGIVVGVIAPHREELLSLFLPARNRAPVSIGRISAGWAVRISMLCVAFAFTYWVANYNNRFPTPIDGSWDVVEVQPTPAATRLPKVLFFEYNRAGMVVFKSNEGVYNTHHFEVDQSTDRILIWEKWLGKGSEIFTGEYKLANADLTLAGDFQSVGKIMMHLRKRSQP